MFITTIISIAGILIIVLTAVYLTQRIVWRLMQIDTEKEQLNQQLVGASRLAELGEMAAGFAHEINNTLQIINNEHVLMEMGMDALEETCPGREKERRSCSRRRLFCFNHRAAHVVATSGADDVRGQRRTAFRADGQRLGSLCVVRPALSRP